MAEILFGLMMGIIVGIAVGIPIGAWMLEREERRG